MIKWCYGVMSEHVLDTKMQLRVYHNTSIILYKTKILETLSRSLELFLFGYKGNFSFNDNAKRKTSKTFATPKTTSAINPSGQSFMMVYCHLPSSPRSDTGHTHTKK